MKARSFCAAAIAAATLAACAALPQHSAEPTAESRAVVAAPDRTEADRKTDERRKPEMMLAFTGVKAGMKVLDLGASTGYSTELLARSVGPQGVVYAQNTQAMIDQFIKNRFDERAAKPAMRNVVKLVREFEDPAPAEVHDLDLVTQYFEYHDAPARGFDRAKMNRRVFELLKPGGYYVIADHSAKPGSGASAGKTLHRIDEALVREEVEAAGFKLVAVGNFLRNPDDPRDEVTQRSKVRVDEFVLKFLRP